MMVRLIISIVFLSLFTEGRREYEFGRRVRVRRQAKLLAVNLPTDETSNVHRESNALFKEDVFRNLHMSGSFSYSYSAPTKKDKFGDILSGEAPSPASIGNSTIEADVSSGAILEGGASSLASISNTTTESEVSGNVARSSTQDSPVATGSGSGASSKTAGIAVCAAGAVMVLVSAAVVFARRHFRGKESLSQSEC